MVLGSLYYADMHPQPPYSLAGRGPAGHGGLLGGDSRHAHPGDAGSHRPDLRDMGLLDGAGQTAEFAAAWLAAPLHMHIFVLGFQFTLPAEETEDDGPSPDGHQLAHRAARHRQPVRNRGIWAAACLPAALVVSTCATVPAGIA